MAAKSVGDHALAAIKAGLSWVPYVGGPLASLIGDYIPTSTERSVATSLELLAHRLEALGDRVDVEAVDKEEFAELFKSAYVIMMRAHTAERRRAAANLVANLLLKSDDPERLPYTELDHFARAIESLSVGALRCAAEIFRDRRSQEDRARSNFERLSSRMPDLDPDLLMGLLGELNAQNIIHLPGPPAIRTAKYANYPIERTALGARFVERLLTDSGSAS